MELEHLFENILKTVGQRQKDIKSANPGMPNDQIVKEALKQLLQEVEDPQNQAFIDQKKMDAGNFVRGVRSNSESERHERTKRFREETIASQKADPFPEPKLIKNAVVEVLNDRGRNAPDWLNINDIEFSPEAAEFAVRVSLLPDSLQTNPEVVYHELARFYNRVPWTELTPEAYREINGVIQRTYEKVLTPAGFNPDEFFSEVDTRSDIYRTVKLGPKNITANKGEPEYEKQKLEAEQRRQLEITLNTAQRQIDSIIEPNKSGDPGTDINNQISYYRRQVDNYRMWINELATGQARTTGHAEDVEYNFPKFTPEAQPYLEKLRFLQENAQRRLDVFEQEEKIFQQRRIDLSRSKASCSFDEARELLTPEQFERLKERIKTEELKDYYAFTHIDPQDVAEIKKGPKGMQKYLFEKLFGIHGSGRERNKPTLMEEYEFKEFEEFFKWLYGSDKDVYFQDYQFNWNEWGRQDYVIKTLMYEPGDPKDKFLALRRILGADVDRNSKVEHANMAISLYMQVLDEHQMDSTNNWFESYEFLTSTVSPEDFAEFKKMMEAAKVSADDRAADMNYDYFYLYIRELHRKRQLPDGFYKKFLEIERHVERCAKGTVLTDEDVLNYNELHNLISGLDLRLKDLEKNGANSARDQEEIEKIKNRIAHKEKARDLFELDDLRIRLHQLEQQQQSRSSLSPEEQTELTEIQKKIKELSTRLDYPTSFSAIEKEENLLSTTELGLRRGYSPLEWEVRCRLKVMVEDKLGRKLLDDGSEEWMLRRAVGAARFNMIASSIMMTKGALNVIKPMALKGELKSIDVFTGKSVMWAPFMEDVVRVINPDYFEERFNMGEPYAGRLREIRKLNILKGKGYAKGVDIRKTEEYKRLKNTGLTPEERLSRAYIDFARRETGIESEYVLTEGWFRGGGTVDSSLWRPEAGLMDELKLACDKAGYPHAWKNLLLWFQFASIGTEKTEDILARKEILKVAIERAPSAFFHNLAGEIVTRIKTDNKIEAKEWRAFMRALTVTETSLWQDWSLAGRDVSLRGADFDLLLKPKIIKFLEDAKVPDAQTRAGIFQKVLNDLYTEVAINRNLGGGRKFQYDSIMDAMAKHNFPFTLSYADMDWSVANFFKLSTATWDRRGRDQVAMQATRDIQFQLDTNPEFVRPHGEKGVHEWVEKIAEYEQSFNTYDSRDSAEAAALEMVRQCLSFNRSRAADVTKLVGWIPGYRSLMRALAEVELEHTPILNKFKFWNEFLDNNNLIGKKLKHYPHSAAEAVSLSVRFFGPEAEDWDIHRVDHIIDTLQHKGIFAKHPEYYGLLRREFRTTFGWRLLDIPRKYGWIVLAATIAVATLQATEEEKSKSRSH